jgi:hypothetical protein
MLEDDQSSAAWADGDAVEDLYGMSRATDPVLAELWDNETDAEYDRL